MAKKTVKIEYAISGGKVTPAKLDHVRTKDEVVFTIDQGTATVFVPDATYIENQVVEEDKPVTGKVKGKAILLKVSPNKESKITRKKSVPDKLPCPYAVYIDGTDGFAMQATSPVMILDPP
jgi:hypothetical protein